MQININADLGEMAGQDEEIMPYLSSCNIATGGHVGDIDSMQRAISLAKKHNVKIGAHPSYPDLENFGRIRPKISDEDLKESLTHQLSTFYEIAVKNNVDVHHIKPHGALYHDVINDRNKAELFLNVLDDLGLKTSIYTMKNEFLDQLGKKNHIIHNEAFIDRRYTIDLRLVSRKHPNALIENPEEVWEQLYSILYLNKINVISGEVMDIKADTFCIHGDHPNAVKILKYIKFKLEKLKP
ncbi:lactam utilization protein LamB [Brumimicrobium glaciale]|uniref:Lactam utilization protein LamB n=1 Tax=Brumimicrobium glaciale TaxID=200475 RepID=A0A4Q4KMF2_9FLAO|nr:LamB/YcsF family protein [Brumimicrobium glaciale]RYM33937.1 lactam utilization protein LamB [Brumimicrobium glaciale]